MIAFKPGHLSFNDFKNIVFKDHLINLAEDDIASVELSHNFLKKFSKNKVIYGINTGFGPMARYKIEEPKQVELQYNLIRSHASGMGDILSPLYAKASMLARLSTLSLGYSGIHPSVIYTLQHMINKNVLSVIYEKGGVGASGDLVQLAHMALGLIGEGDLWHQNQLYTAEEALQANEIKPIDIKLREGLAIMNGTSVMTGIGLVNATYAEKAVEWSIAATILICELVNSFDDYFSPNLNESKKHSGQQFVAKSIKKHLDESTYIRSRLHHLYQIDIDNGNILDDKVQEYYSIRCVPQIVGIIYETVKNCQKVLIEEINSANDNPIVDVKNETVVHGGNFHGDYVSFEMDKLKIALTKLSMLAERQINFLMNPALNGILPPFLNMGKLGFNFGMQGVQFTATSTTAENQTLSNPMYIHSIPNNNDNQDIVSMGTNAALLTKKVIDNTFSVLAVEFMSLVQAVDILQKKEGLSPATKNIYDGLKAITPATIDDHTHFVHLEAIKKHLMSDSPNIL